MFKKSKDNDAAGEAAGAVRDKAAKELSDGNGDSGKKTGE